MNARLLSILLIIASLAGSMFMVPAIAASAGRAKITITERAEDSDPPEVSLGIAMGAFRGLFVNMLWMRANDMKEQGLFHEAIELANTITKLQPRFPRVWVFHAWNLAYNISVETQTPEERYQWVMSGVRLLRDEAIPANPNDLMLHKELAWILLHKIGGYTDDANRYYKREWAAEWTVVVGVPPRPEPGARDRDAVIEQYAAWLRPIADAPATLDGLYERSPGVKTLVDRLAAEADTRPDKQFLQRWTQHDALKSSPRRAMYEAEFGPNNVAFSAMFNDPALADEWAALVPFVRKRVIIDEYHMDPAKMIRYTRKFGPLDWRHHGSHGVYWAAQGIERSQTRFDEYNRQNFDFVNTDRMVMQAIQSLYRSGDIYFNYLTYLSGGRGYFQGMPNPYFVESYGDMYRDVVERAGVYEDPSRPRRNYAVGYENFLADAVSFFYRRGEMERAEKWYEHLRTWEGQNVVGGDFDNEDFGTLEEFVTKNLFDRFTSPHVAGGQVMASLQGAYQALISGDSELFRGQFDFARQAHAYFMSNQFREVVASQGSDARMEFMDRDFRYVAGGVFAATIDSLAFDEAALAYSYAPDSLKQYAYDMLAERFRTALNESPTEEGQTFEDLFPEPPGMEQFRAYLAQKERERRESDVDSINQR
jgi:hypothetical protein